jgi:putative hydrolase of HD superfamily
MATIGNLLFEAKMLKDIPRSGYQYLGKGQESVAEHTYITTFIGFVMSKLEPNVNALKLISMCLMHDLPEARIGDLNSVQKQYVRADEGQALADMSHSLPFGQEICNLVDEFNTNNSLESQLAHDADQLAFILDLKALADVEFPPSTKWLDFVIKRLKTETGRKICQSIMATEFDTWWLNNFIDRS